MKTSKRYLASSIYVALFVALFPFAIIKIILDLFFDFCVKTLDSLEAIADDE